MLITLKDFRITVDGMMPRLPRDSDPETAKAFVNLQSDPHYQRDKVTEALTKRVKSAFQSGHRVVFDHCRQLISELIHDHVLEKAPLDPYFEIIATIKDAMRSNTVESNVQGDWSAAIQAAIDSSEWFGSLHRPTAEMVYRAEFASAQAARRTRGIGPRKRPGIDASEAASRREKAIGSVIEKAAAHMGGIELAKRLFSMLAPKFNAEQGRYHDVNHFSLAGPMESRVPVGFLLNLAAKHPVAKKPIRRSEDDWNRLILQSKDAASLYQVQPASNLDGLFTDALSLLPLLRRLSLHDSIFSPVQMRPTDVIRLSRGLVGGLRDTGNVPESAEREVSKTIAVIEGLQQLIASRKGPVQFNKSDLISHCVGVEPHDIETILTNSLAHPIGTANKNFSLPSEVPDDSLPREERAGPNIGERPLITIDRDRYLILDHSVCSPAMLEVVLSRFRELGIDSKMGYAIESFLINVLLERGVIAKSGKYKVGKQIWECDLVIETPKRIIFIETKKKALTRAARAGLDAALLVDMTDSLVSAILQAGRHQYEIIKEGALVLTTSDGKIEKFELGGRAVERIAVTLPDFGSFQDRALLSQILNSQLTIAFSTSELAFKTKIEKVNEKLHALRELNNSLYEQAGKPSNWQPFFNSWFLSVPQLLVLLDDVRGCEDFDSELNRTRHLTMGTRDFYFEHHYAKSVIGVAKRA
ncbi:hypothetical protein KDX01_02265 [Burkholderia vietnamiensis]|uniref:hypothetical protein n=1 Tax=Burkholderia vietnamiensis TaxID=60552 RepID=UPI001B92B232|nr:hypothetical protein [Burkholderia vietnamiensis]MBR7971942.1 hypothetical protein [Burkholderia vietnamiensis]